MLKRIAIYGSEQAWVRRVVMSTPVTRQVALRFVAGGDLAAGLATARALNARGIGASLNYLGMHERDEGQAKAAADEAVKAVRQIGTQGLDAHISVKLTRVGLDIDEDFCRNQLDRIAESAADAGVFVRIDMEESPYVSRILRLFNEQLDRHGPDAVGIVLQSYLVEHTEQVRSLIASGARIRIVKGGYREPAEVALQHQGAIDAAFRDDIGELLGAGYRPAIATHDTQAIDFARRRQGELGLANSAFEFQMLYGIRRDLQQSLVADGYAVRCYVPYGGHFLGYVLGSIRRLPVGVRGGSKPKDPTSIRRA